MQNYFKPISISLSPNVEKDDLKLALNLIIRPQLWKNGKGTHRLEDFFENFLGVKYAFSFNSGRSALFAILKSLNLSEGSDVLMQGFTCNAVPNPVLWAKLNPVYVDCLKDTFNMDIEGLKRKISPSAKVLIIQHTFGLPADVEEIILLAKQKNIFIIEDCAHALGSELKGKKLGTFGDAAFFSFARDKVISCVYGGMAVCDNKEIAEKLLEVQKNFAMPSNPWIFQQILHPILLNYIILPVYNFFDLGKFFLVLSQWLHILSKAVSWQEKQGQKPDYFPKALPNALCIMALNQLEKLDKFYLHRKEISDFYKRELAGTSFILPAEKPEAKQSYLRFTVRHVKAHEIIYEAWHNQNILLGDWYTTCIAPFDTKLDEMKYKKECALWQKKQQMKP